MMGLWILIWATGGLSFLMGLLSVFASDYEACSTMQGTARTLAGWAQIMLGLLVAKHLGVW
jgi:hypothetical protein